MNFVLNVIIFIIRFRRQAFYPTNLSNINFMNFIFNFIGAISLNAIFHPNRDTFNLVYGMTSIWPKLVMIICLLQCSC